MNLALNITVRMGREIFYVLLGKKAASQRSNIAHIVIFFFRRPDGWILYHCSIIFVNLFPETMQNNPLNIVSIFIPLKKDAQFLILSRSWNCTQWMCHQTKDRLTLRGMGSIANAEFWLRFITSQISDQCYLWEYTLSVIFATDFLLYFENWAKYGSEEEGSAGLIVGEDGEQDDVWETLKGIRKQWLW